MFTLMLLLACTKDTAEDTAEAALDPLSWAVDEPGPYNTGYRYWEVTYQPLAPEGESRTIGINVWYPTEDTEGDDVEYLAAFPDEDSLGDAAIAAPAHDGGWPVRVHSHGSQAWGGHSDWLNQHMASHGWITVAPDHTENTLLDHVDPSRVAHYIHRPQDITQALDALAADPDFAGAVTDAVLMSGHSRGCGTVWSSAGAAFEPEVCSSLSDEGCTDAELDAFLSGALADERLVGAVPMGCGYPDQFFGDAPAGVAAPFFMMTGSEDGNNLPDVFDGMSAVDRTWIDIAGACHETFGLGVACDTIDQEEGYSIVEAYTLAFARSTVLGDDSVAGILDGTEVVSDAVTLRRASSR